jgi:hypothetical protein
MQDTLTKVQEDVTALSQSVSDLVAALQVPATVSTADKVLEAVKAVLVSEGWTEPTPNVEAAQ